MIVVVIMAILVAVAVPVYVSVTKSVEEKTCLNNSQVLSALLTNYINGVFTGEKETIPDFQILNVNGQPVFKNADGTGPNADVSDVGAWLIGKEQNPSSLCCISGGTLSVEVVHTSEGAVYVRVACSKSNHNQ